MKRIFSIPFREVIRNWTKKTSLKVEVNVTWKGSKKETKIIDTQPLTVITLQIRVLIKI